MHQETFQEKSYHDMLPSDLKSTAHVTFGYQDYLRIIQEHLQTFYGHRADWSQCVDMYFHSPVYQDFCHNAKQCEDIPIITAEQLYKMIQENEDYQTNIENFLQLNQIIKDSGAYANANLYKLIKKEDNFYKIEQVDIYSDLLFDGKNSNGIAKFETLFDENDKKMVLLCQEKDYKLFKKLKEIYYQYKEIKGNPFINYLIEIGEYKKDGIAGVHYGIRQSDKNSALVKTLRYYTPITDPYLINKKNINKKDKTYIGYNSLTQVCTQIFYDEEKKKYVFLPINKICVKNGKIDENNEYYKMIYQKTIGDKKLKFIDNIYCGDCVDVIKKDGTIISDYYSGYHKTNNKLVLKSGQYFTQYDQDIIIYDVDVLGNKKRRIRD